MDTPGQVTVADVENALRRLGGEATWADILNQLTTDRNGDFSNYRDWRNYKTTAFQVVQKHCPGYKKYEGTTRFERVGMRFRLADGFSAPAVDLLGAEADEYEPPDDEGYSPEGTDRRPLVYRQIRERRGQRQFRDDLRGRYGDRCLVTGCQILAVLEAAHIRPYRGENDNHPENGLLLRSDVHTLFDLDLLGIEPEQLRVELHPAVAAEYGHLPGVVLGCAPSQRPSRAALEQRYSRFRQRLLRPA
jgi:hypothetical protein